MNRTLIIIKPDATERNIIGKILSIIEESGFKIIGMKMLKISKEDAERFYAVHKGKPFFESLTSYISSGKIVVAVVEKENAVEDMRKLIGATDPKKAENGTIRKLFGIDIEKNSIHASDSPESAEFEIKFFFRNND